MLAGGWLFTFHKHDVNLCAHDPLVHVLSCHHRLAMFEV